MLQSKNGVLGEGGREAAHHVDVAGFAVRGIEDAEGSGYCYSPVASLGYVLVVPELEHEFMAGFCVLCCSEPTFLHTLTKSIIREGRGNNVKSGS